MNLSLFLFETKQQQYDSCNEQNSFNQTQNTNYEPIVLLSINACFRIEFNVLILVVNVNP